MTTINPTNNSNYQSLTTSPQNAVSTKFELKGISNNIDIEEDKILYEQLKKTDVDFDKHSFEWQKEHIVSFPPLTSPGYVRKAFREALEKVPEAQRTHLAFGLNMLYHNSINNSPNSTFNDTINNMLNYTDKFKGLISTSDFEGFNNILSSLTGEIKKYNTAE